LQTLGLLALQIGVVAGLAAGVRPWLKAASARRAVWLGALLGVAVILANACTGIDRKLVRGLRPGPLRPSIATAQGNLPPTLRARSEELARRGVVLPMLPVPAKRDQAVWWPAWFWLAGLVLVGGRALVSRLLLARLGLRSWMTPDPETGERVAALAGSLRLRRAVRLVESASLVGPIAFGWRRPTIGLPKGFFTNHSRVEQDTMLAHELAHLAARDPLWLALADALSTVLWWHPAVWWLRRQFRIASETAADDASLLVQDGPVILADCLVSLAAQLQGRRATGWLGMAEFRSGLGRRVERLLQLRPDEAGVLGQKARWVATAMVAAVLLGLVSAVWAFPDSGSDSPTLFALVQEVIRAGPPADSDLPRKPVISVPETGHNSPTNAAVRLAAERELVEPGIEPAQAATNHQAGSKLFTRIFKVDLNRIAKAIGEVPDKTSTNSLSKLREALLKHFARAGWTLGEGEALFLNQSNSGMYVRASLQALDLIESVLQVLNTAPPQVMVQAKFVEFSESDATVMGLDWILGSLPGGQTDTNALRTAQAPTPQELRGDELDWAGRAATNARNIRVNASLGSQLTGILTDPQFRVVLRALEQRSGTDVLSTPSVTTLSGRQAQIRVQEMKTVVTGSEPAAGTNGFTTAVIPCGPMLDVLPTVLADGYTIQLNLKASVTEFLGYDPATPGVAGSAQPRFRQRELTTIANVWDGQTLVLGGPLVEAAGSTTNRTAGVTALRKQLLVFVTPRLIDPAGNRLHAGDEMPFSTNAVPPQPQPGK